MKFKNQLFKSLLIIFLATVSFSCSNNTILTIEKVEVIIDGNTAYFSNNIEAKSFRLPATTGFSDYFQITSEDISGNSFRISKIFPISGSATLPVSGTIPAPESNILNAYGLDLNDGNSGNSLTYTVTAFGEVGEQINATITGTYFDTNNVSHSLQINIDVTRDMDHQ